MVREFLAKKRNTGQILGPAGLVTYALFLSASSCLASQISLSFDDAPRRGGYFSGPERARRLINGLEQAGVSRVWFYATTDRFTPEGKRRVRAYAMAGHGIANHTHTHPDLNKVSVEAYNEDISKAHAVIGSLKAFVPYFRYPFLREGNTEKKREGVRKHLSHLGYKNGYVTVDNYDWYLDYLFQKAVAKKEKIDWAALKELYIQTIWDCIHFYDEMARKWLKRSPKHVLLLHENDLAALYIVDLVAFLNTKGWEIVTPEVSYQDPISNEVPTHLAHSQGRVAAIARARGYQGPIYHVSESEPYLEQQFNAQVLVGSQNRVSN